MKLKTTNRDLPKCVARGAEDVFQKNNGNSQKNEAEKEKSHSVDDLRLGDRTPPIKTEECRQEHERDDGNDTMSIQGSFHSEDLLPLFTLHKFLSKIIYRKQEMSMICFAENTKVWLN